MWANTEGTNWSSEVPTDPMVMPKRQNWREGGEGKETGMWNQAIKKDAGLLFGMGKVQEALSRLSIDKLYFQDHRKVK